MTDSIESERLYSDVVKSVDSSTKEASESSKMLT